MDRVRQPLVLLVALGHLASLPRPRWRKAEGDIFRPRRPLLDGDEHEAHLFSAAAKRLPGGRRRRVRGRCGDQDDPEEPARSHLINLSATLTWLVTSDIDSLATGDRSPLFALALSLSVLVLPTNIVSLFRTDEDAQLSFLSRSLGCYLRCRHLERKPIVIIMGGRRTRPPTPRLSLTHSLSGED